MAQLAGFRGALWDRAKADVDKLALGPIDVPGKLAAGELVRDATRAVYRYHVSFPTNRRTITRKSLVCAVGLEPWSEGTIRPHEATDPQARSAAAQRFAKAGAYDEPVLAGYRDPGGDIERLFRSVDTGKPVVKMTTADGTEHKLWRVSSAEVLGSLRRLFAPRKIHVLDGHARYEAMLDYRASLGELSMYSSANYGLFCLVDLAEPALVVAPRHRLVRGAFERDAVLAAVKPWFEIDKLGDAATSPDKQRAALAATVAHQPAFVVVFAGDKDAYKLMLKPDVSPVNEGVEVHRAIQKYDPVVVDKLFLARGAPGAQIAAELDPAVVAAQVHGGQASLGVIMRPLSLEQIVHADEVGELLPASSDAFFPALVNFVGYVVDRDEDLV